MIRGKPRAPRHALEVTARVVGQADAHAKFKLSGNRPLRVFNNVHAQELGTLPWEAELIERYGVMFDAGLGDTLPSELVRLDLTAERETNPARLRERARPLFTEREIAVLHMLTAELPWADEPDVTDAQFTVRALRATTGEIESDVTLALLPSPRLAARVRESLSPLETVTRGNPNGFLRQQEWQEAQALLATEPEQEGTMSVWRGSRVLIGFDRQALSLLLRVPLVAQRTWETPRLLIQGSVELD